MTDAQAGRLYVVSTPIGNLGDITVRAIETLREVSVILAEDTRHSRTLLARHDITTPVEAYHEHNEARATPGIVARLRAGESFALISDAGTPLLSDPGARLVRAAIEAGVVVSPLPGASALLAALTGAGLDAERFTFFGFLPRKGRERTAALDAIVTLPHTAVIYEAANRVGDTLRDLAAHGARGRDAVVAREMTKQFEEFRRGTVDALAEYYGGSAPRGEVVLLLAGAAPRQLDEGALREHAQRLRAGGASTRDIVRLLVEDHDAPRNLAYRLAHE
ncbi:MAG TPA: 16S rRNA (cytidine(1402)-2'-O)-methyltransferase [Gemmatimonadaceae bacterium]|nr:16S rRNA (cytidine(1402)-2'-O)-methyltransferase [Gemmatimonadaceae bacterium]